MIDPRITQAAKRLWASKDLELLVEEWKAEKLGIITSTSVDNKKLIRNSLLQYHAIDEFFSFIEQIKVENDG